MIDAVRNEEEFRQNRIVHRDESSAGRPAAPYRKRSQWSSAWPIANRPQIANLPHNARR